MKECLLIYSGCRRGEGRGCIYKCL